MSTNVLIFHSRSKNLGKTHDLPCSSLRDLSNFSMHSVEYDGKIYPSLEHAFQALKYLFSNKPEIAPQFEIGGSILSPQQAKSAGSKGGMKERGAVLNVDFWNKKRDEIMIDLVESKIRRNAEIRNILEIAKRLDIRFVHFSRMDMYWGAHVNEDGTIKKGENHLGKTYNRWIESRI